MKKDYTTAMPAQFCKCGYKLTMATGKKPVTVGDLSVCFNCGNIAEWTAEGKLIQITEEQIKTDPIVYAEATRLRVQIIKRGPIKRKSGIFNPFSTN